MTGASKPAVKAPFHCPTHFPTTLERKFYQIYNWFDNRLWPVRPVPFAATCAAVVAYNLKFADNVMMGLLPTAGNEYLEVAKVVGVSVTATYVPLFVLRKLLKYFYFSYKGYLHENPKKPSIKTKIWGVVRHLLSYAPPMLESCDRLLPNLPVPPLKQTVQKYLQSVQPILSKDEFELVKQHADGFLHNEGRSLQTYVWLYSMFTDNYVTNFWEKYAYLYNRAPAIISSSVAHVDLLQNKPATRAHRAARVLWIETMSHLAIDRQDYKTLGEGLVCTRHYKKMYAVSRVPGETVDHLDNHGIQKYAVVELRGFFYKVDLCDANNRIFSIAELTKIFAELLARDAWEAGPLKRVAAFTHDTRDGWHRNRKRFFLENATNRKTLDIIERAFVILNLDERDDFDYDPERPEKLSNFMLNMLVGDGANRWVDKSLNYICSRNTRCGGMTEHTIADGAEFDHIMENFITMDNYVLGYKSLEEQAEMEKIDEDEKRKLVFAQKLDFELVNEEMKSEMNRCYESHAVVSKDVDLFSLIFRDFGKGRIKQCGVSPDAFIQMAIQLAHYREQGKFGLTYEPASVRFFANSRTETLRTVNEHSCKFVLAMVDPQQTKEARIELLRKACVTHVNRNKECMVGDGIDRHLFVLYIMSKATGVSSNFLDHYISQPWLISTSHVPNVTNSVDEDADENLTWLGASFSAVAKDGYGVCYRFGGNHSILANVTSYHSASNTDSQRFASTLAKTFHELSELFA